MPVATTTAVAEPLSTLVPRNAIAANSSGEVGAAPAWLACFSIGMLSPVNDPWLTNRSLACTIRTSPGTMSPAASSMTSPGTSSAIGTSRVRPSRRAVACTEIIARSLAALLPARVSWTSLSARLSTIISSITMAAAASADTNDAVASTARRITSGLSTARPRSLAKLGRSSRASALGPCSASSSAARDSVSPPTWVASRAYTSAGSRAAVSITSGATRIAAASRRPA